MIIKEMKISGNDSHTAAVHNNKIYSFGGRQAFRVDCYDVATDSWTPDAIELPEDMQHGQERNLLAGVIGSDMFIFGKNDYSTRTQPFISWNFEENEWKTWPSAPAKRYDAAGVVAEGKFYIIGGSDVDSMEAMMGRGSSQLHNSVYVFDPASSTWSTVAPMCIARSDHRAAYADGYIYVTGGKSTPPPPAPGSRKQKKSAVETAETERYCIATNTWERLPPMSKGPRDQHDSVAFRGKIYVVGGVGPTSTKFQSKCEVYDPATNTWTQTFSLGGRHAFPAVVVDSAANIANNDTKGKNVSNNNNDNADREPKKAKTTA